MRKRLLLLLPLLLFAALSPRVWRQYVRDNFHVVVDGQLYRSASPSVGDLEGWIDAHGLAAVLNLRDDRGFPRAREAVEAKGARYEHRPFSDRVLPERAPFLALLDELETLPGPLLIHCRAGADRAGVVSALALMARHGASFAEARRQLDADFGHFGSSEDAVEGVLLRYERYCERFGRDAGGWVEFRAWADAHYSQAYFLATPVAPDTIRAAPRSLARVELRVVNPTDREVPVGRRIKLAAYAGSAEDLVPDREYPPRQLLTEAIPAHGELRLAHEFWTPNDPGRYEIRFGLLEEDVTWFAAEGAADPPSILLIGPG